MYSSSSQNTLSYELVSGPEWLNISSTGLLSGIPADADTGSANAVISVINSIDSSSSTFNINIANTYTGVNGINDFAGLAAQWMNQECQDSPACGGADLNGDKTVDIDDIEEFGSNWLLQ